MSRGIVCAATSSSALSAWPELYPAAGAPVTSAPRYTLKRFVYCGPEVGSVASSVDSGTIAPSWPGTSTSSAATSSKPG
jgi:hypothetical protein